MPIVVLAPDVVSKIAAGEVVERPASVVKELVENALDAGASQISIEANGGGVNWVRVSDNGAGIPRDDIRLAFQRHATSKIASLADLDNTTSLGFRGEALPSIAHVAQVELVTRSKDAASGTYVRVQDGKVAETGVRAHPQGTTVTVRNLFRRIPARLKFLKSASTENGHITNLVSQYSLAFPRVRFTLVIERRRVLHTPGSGSLRDVIAEIYGLPTAQAMLEIERTGKEVGIAPVVGGYISPPSLSRASRSYVSFFVNQRWVQSRSLARAVEKAYEGLLGSGRYPVAVVNLAVSPQSVDVNVHPTKREVRFSQEPIVFNTVYGAVRRTLAARAPVPEMGASPISVPVPTTQQKSLELPVAEERDLSAPLTMSQAKAAPEMPALRVLGQIASTYIIAEGPDGLYLIDQHAAHERVLFEKVQAQRAQQGVEVQSLLEPLTIELDPRQEEMLKGGEHILGRFGFGIEPFGERTILLRTVPAMLAGKGIEGAVKEALESLDEDSDPARTDERLAASLACHGAVRAGQVLTQDEMRQLVRQLEKASCPRTCPHGRPTMVYLSSGRLEREFGRG